MSIPLAFALVFSMIFVAAPVFARVEVVEAVQGRTFIIRHQFTWDMPDEGIYMVSYIWECPLDHPWENFTFLEAKAYFENGDAIENDVSFWWGPTDTGTRYVVEVQSISGDNRNGDFYVDIVLRAASGDGTPHALGDHMTTYEYYYCDGYCWEDYFDIAVRVFPAVEVGISPSRQEGAPGGTLEYAVTISNVGETTYSFALVAGDNAGWNPTLSENLLENVGPGENRVITLSVTVPENTTSFDEDNITFTATSVEYAWVSDSVSCVGQVQGIAEFALATLYGVSLDAGLYLGSGSKLVLKFYTYADFYQGENVVWSGSTPDNVSFSKVVPHPQGDPVERARLMHTDNEENVISTMADFIVRQGNLMGRISAIKVRWPFAPPPEKSALMQEISGIKGQWPFAPY